LEIFNLSIIYSFLSFLASFVSLGVSIYLSPHFKDKSARLLMLLMVSIAVWSLSTGMEFISPGFQLKLWWVKTGYVGAVWIGTLIFSFVFALSVKRWELHRTSYVLLSIIPFLAILTIWTNDYHHFIWTHAWIDTTGVSHAVMFNRGPGFWIFLTYIYILVFLAIITLVYSLCHAQGILKKQLISVLVGILFPLFTNILYLFSLDEFKLLDLTPISFTISGFAFFMGLLKYQMLNLIPLIHKAVLDSMDDPVIALDMHDRILNLNRSSMLLIKTDLIPILLRLEEVFPTLYRYVTEHRKPHPVEAEISFLADQQMKHWKLRISPLLNNRNRQNGWLIILRDITDKKNAKSSKEESDRIHRIMLEASPNPIIYYNQNGEATYINPAFTRVFGWEADEILGKQIDFVPEDNWKETRRAITKTLEQPKGNYDFITRRYTKSREILDVSINSALYRSEDNLSTNMVVNITDITKIKKIEHELRNTKNFIRSIINSMPSMLIGLDINGVITQWNLEAEHITEVSSDKAEGNLLKNIFPALSGHLSTVKKSIEQNEIRKESKAVLSFSNKKILTDITIYPIQSGTVQGAVIRVDDIGERVKIEEMMVQSEKMMSIGGLAAGMAHEINNPLAGILQNIQVIRNRLTRDLQANTNAAKELGLDFKSIKLYMEKRNIIAMLELIKSSGEQAAKIIANMLLFGRKSEGRKSTHYLSDIMETTIELIKNTYSIKKRYDFRSIEIIKEYQEKIPPIPCENNEIQQVFLNVLKNGAEAMADEPTTSPRFIIRHFRHNDYVVFEIEDNGPGIDPEIKKRIFEPFFTTKGVGVGTGLGLSVSYFIITENHNGVLTVESSPGRGTIFTIKLPVKQSH